MLTQIDDTIRAFTLVKLEAGTSQTQAYYAGFLDECKGGKHTPNAIPFIDAKWAREAEDRIDAYERGDLKAFTLKKVLKKYR